MRRHTAVFMVILVLCLMAGMAVIVLEVESLVSVPARTDGILMIDFGVLLGAAAVELYFQLNAKEKTDGSLIAGVEDEDGLVFALDTPVEELVKKDRITFNVLRKEYEYADDGKGGN